jgi:hypothetical protein
MKYGDNLLVDGSHLFVISFVVAGFIRNDNWQTGGKYCTSEPSDATMPAEGEARKTMVAIACAEAAPASYGPWPFKNAQLGCAQVLAIKISRT